MPFFYWPAFTLLVTGLKNGVLIEHWHLTDVLYHWECNQKLEERQGHLKSFFFFHWRSVCLRNHSLFQKIVQRFFHMDYFPQENHIVLKTPESIMQTSSYLYFIKCAEFFAINLLSQFLNLWVFSISDATELIMFFRQAEIPVRPKRACFGNCVWTLKGPPLTFMKVGPDGTQRSTYHMSKYLKVTKGSAQWSSG